MNAHGITRIGPAKVGGRHLSNAANAPSFNQSNQPVKGIPMSALLDSQLDTQRLADILREEKAAGITTDKNFVQLVDSAMRADKQVDGYGRRRIARGLELQVDANRRDPLLIGAYE